jgi:RNA polymerase subunit RPABC4/transcription elongation factor Spt4
MTDSDTRPGEESIIGGEERVRPCLECGTILPFKAEVCSLCGERYRVGRIDEESVKPCLACDDIIPARHLFCPKCGDFTLDVEIGTNFVPQIGAREGAVVQGAVRVLAVGTVVAALALVVSAITDLAAIHG